MTKSEEFLAAVRGIPAHHVTKALNQQTSGIDWSRCSKTMMAREYERNFYCRMGNINLKQLAAQAKARQEGNWKWYEARGEA